MRYITMTLTVLLMFSLVLLAGCGSHDRIIKTQEKIDRFLGNGTPGPFMLTQHPVIKVSEVVTVNAVAQPRNEAYTLDYATGRLEFTGTSTTCPVPSMNTLITVRYAVEVPY